MISLNLAGWLGQIGARARNLAIKSICPAAPASPKKRKNTKRTRTGSGLCCVCFYKASHGLIFSLKTVTTFRTSLECPFLLIKERKNKRRRSGSVCVAEFSHIRSSGHLDTNPIRCPRRKENQTASRSRLLKCQYTI